MQPKLKSNYFVMKKPQQPSGLCSCLADSLHTVTANQKTTLNDTLAYEVSVM